jgi:hypothetical protein
MAAVTAMTGQRLSDNAARRDLFHRQATLPARMETRLFYRDVLVYRGASSR